MDSTGLGRAGAASALAFAAVLAALTGLRTRGLLPPTRVQSGLVWAGAAAVVVGVAGHAYRGGSAATGWVLAFGPAAAFAANLFVPAWQGGPLVLVAWVVAVGGLVSGVLTLVGYGVGRVARPDGTPSAT